MKLERQGCGSWTRRGATYRTSPLCAPSMDAVLMGFKSPVRESNMVREHHGKQ